MKIVTAGNGLPLPRLRDTGILQALRHVAQWPLVLVRALGWCWIMVLTHSGAIAATAPIIFNHSPTAFPGDIVSLQGADFGATPYVRYALAGGVWNAMTVITAGNSVVTAQLPITQPVDLFEIEVSPDGQTWSGPVWVNQAHATHFDTPVISSSSPFRIFGRNLLSQGVDPRVRLVDSASGISQVAVVNLAASSRYLLSVTAPSVIIPGDSYQVLVDNGHDGMVNGSGETSADLTLTGCSAGMDAWSIGLPWASDFSFAGNVYDVTQDPRLSMHAVGDGMTNDQPALQAAITVANQAGGGVVYLPAGIYRLTYTGSINALTMASRVVIAGAGAAQTTITYGYGTYGSGDGFAIRANAASVWGVANLTIENVDTTGTWIYNIDCAQGCSEVFLKGVTMHTAGGQQLWFGGAVSRVAVENCDFEQVGLTTSYTMWLGTVSWGVFTGNTMHFTGGQAAELTGSSQVFIQGNHFIRDLSGPLVDNTRTIDTNFATNVAIIGNSFQAINGVPPPTYSDGESILSEGGGGSSRPDEFRGTLSSVSVLNLTDSSQSFVLSDNAVVAIVEGEGAGQWQAVTAVSQDGHTVSVAAPWADPPAAGSHYATFDWSDRNWTIAGNTLSGNREGILLYDAGSMDTLITDNTLTDNAGIWLTPCQEHGNRFTPVWDVQITGNTVIDASGLHPAFIAVSPRMVNETSAFGLQVIGVEVRGNTVSGYEPNVVDTLTYDPGTEGFVNELWIQSASYRDTGVPILLGTIFQGNTAVNCNVGFSLNSAAFQTVLSGSTLTQVTTALQDVPDQGASSGSVDTVSLVGASAGGGTADESSTGADAGLPASPPSIAASSDSRRCGLGGMGMVLLGLGSFLLVRNRIRRR